MTMASQFTKFGKNLMYTIYILKYNTLVTLCDRSLSDVKKLKTSSPSADQVQTWKL